MKFVQYQDCISPHQVPLAKELVKRLGAENFRYVYRDKAQEERVRMGWSMGETEPWFVHIASHPEEASDLIENADILLSGMRDVELWLRRAEKGLTTFVQSERWFKPITLFDLRLFDCSIPGWVRMLHPRYRRMTRRVRKWLISDPHARYLAIGPWAANDMRRIGVPDAKIVPWGYFVEPSHFTTDMVIQRDSELRVLWVGRMLSWKRVDSIIKAVQSIEGKVKLTLIGGGPEKKNLCRLSGVGDIEFLNSVPITRIRSVMREYDVYVLASDAKEGWGAALSEALEEGMHCIGTYEAGSSSTILSSADLFHAGDWRGLAELLNTCVDMKTKGQLSGQGIGQWSASHAAGRLLAI